jgi:hypothetical protein
MAKRQKRVIPPGIAAFVVAVVVFGLFAICSLLASRANEPAWTLTVFFLGGAAIAFGSAGSYEKVVAAGHRIIGLIALIWGIVFLFTSLFATTMAGFGFLQMWAMSIISLFAILGSNEIHLALRAVDHPPTPTPQEPGFFNAVYSKNGRYWFIGYCLAAIVSLVITFLVN